MDRTVDKTSCKITCITVRRYASFHTPKIPKHALYTEVQQVAGSYSESPSASAGMSVKIYFQVTCHDLPPSCCRQVELQLASGNWRPGLRGSEYSARFLPSTSTYRGKLLFLWSTCRLFICRWNKTPFHSVKLKTYTVYLLTDESCPRLCMSSFQISLRRMSLFSRMWQFYCKIRLFR